MTLKSSSTPLMLVMNIKTRYVHKGIQMVNKLIVYDRGLCTMSHLVVTAMLCWSHLFMELLLVFQSYSRLPLPMACYYSAPIVHWYGDNNVVKIFQFLIRMC